MISPTLACADWLNLEKEIRIMDKAGVDFYHIDIMDGHYVPNLCFNLDILKGIRSISDTPVDVHLMVTNPMDYIDKLAELSVELCCTHQDCCDDIPAFLDKLEENGIKKGLAVSPDVEIEDILPYIERLDYVLMMFVKPGFSGQKFQEQILEKLLKLDMIRCERGLELMIEADGGVSWNNAASLVENGTDMLVSGVFASLDRKGELGERTAVFRALCSPKHGDRFIKHLFRRETNEEDRTGK